jgi:hypothetical protein
VFGKDQGTVKKILERHHVPITKNDHYHYLQFPIQSIELLKNREVDIVISSNVVEIEQNQQVIHEVRLEWTTPRLFEMEEV